MTFNESMQIDPNRVPPGGGPRRGGKIALGGAGGLIILVLALVVRRRGSRVAAERAQRGPSHRGAAGHGEYPEPLRLIQRSR
jgi:predicted metalloprotease